MGPLSIIIITLNEEKRIGRLLGDLCSQTCRNFEVLVIDSNSEDKTRDIARLFENALPSLTVHRMSRQGASLGRNTGAALAHNERLLFLDADVRLAPDFLQEATNHLDSSGLEVAGVYMGAKDLSLVYKFCYTLFNIGFFLTQFSFPTAVGACIFSSKRVHGDLGGFDEQIVLCEDCDYVRRAAKTWRFRFLPITFTFDPRRLDRDGLVKMGLTYLRANVWRFFFGEMRNNEMEYKFGQY